MKGYGRHTLRKKMLDSRGSSSFSGIRRSYISGMLQKGAKRTMKKRMISIVLVLALLVQILPTYVFAENDASDTSPVEAVEMETGETGKVVLGEMTDRRGQPEKHFRMNDGSYIAVSKFTYLSINFESYKIKIDVLVTIIFKCFALF